MNDDLGRFVSSVIEFIIAGALFVSSLLLAAHFLYPADLAKARADVSAVAHGLGSDTLALIFGAAYLYVLGAFAENTSRQLLEWRLNQVKRKRLQLRADKVVDHGNMRFRVMAANSHLYVEIDSQVKRLRIERVFALSLLIVLLSDVVLIIRKSTTSRVVLAGLLILAIGATFLQINERFKRYCRAIERGYDSTMKGHP